MLPPAPMRFSTTTCCCHSSDHFSATIRAVKSAAPPGVKVDGKSRRLKSSHVSLSRLLSFFLMLQRPPSSTTMPYPTLFRSQHLLLPQQQRYHGQDPRGEVGSTDGREG